MYFRKIAELISEKIDCPVEDITNETNSPTSALTPLTSLSLL